MNSAITKCAQAASSSMEVNAARDEKFAQKWNPVFFERRMLRNGFLVICGT